MKDGSPFGLAGLWENWKNPNTGEWERTFAIMTVPSNELVAQIHNRMPAILETRSYDRWLGTEPDPHDLLITYPSEPMTMWPISTRRRSRIFPQRSAGQVSRCQSSSYRGLPLSITSTSWRARQNASCSGALFPTGFRRPASAE